MWELETKEESEITDLWSKIFLIQVSSEDFSTFNGSSREKNWVIQVTGSDLRYHCWHEDHFFVPPM